VDNSSHHPYHRLPWRKHSADLYRWDTGALESIEQRDGISAAMESKFISARRSYFGGQSGGQGLQQSRSGVATAARTGWAPA